MKKVMLGVLAVGMLATSGMAAYIQGKVIGVITYNGTTKVRITKDAGGDTIRPLTGTADAVKAMTAIALTAKSTGNKVQMYVGTYNSVTGWIGIEETNLQ